MKQYYDEFRVSVNNFATLKSGNTFNFEIRKKNTLKLLVIFCELY